MISNILLNTIGRLLILIILLPILALCFLLFILISLIPIFFIWYEFKDGFIKMYLFGKEIESKK